MPDKNPGVGVEHRIPGQKNKGRELEVTVWGGKNYGMLRVAEEISSQRGS